VIIVAGVSAYTKENTAAIIWLGRRAKLTAGATPLTTVPGEQPTILPPPSQPPAELSTKTLCPAPHHLHS
jgi:hypothetical protein